MFNLVAIDILLDLRYNSGIFNKIMLPGRLGNKLVLIVIMGCQLTFSRLVLFLLFEFLQFTLVQPSSLEYFAVKFFKLELNGIEVGCVQRHLLNRLSIPELRHAHAYAKFTQAALLLFILLLLLLLLLELVCWGD